MWGGRKSLSLKRDSENATSGEGLIYLSDHKPNNWEEIVILSQRDRVSWFRRCRKAQAKHPKKKKKGGQPRGKDPASRSGLGGGELGEKRLSTAPARERSNRRTVMGEGRELHRKGALGVKARPAGRRGWY